MSYIEVETSFTVKADIRDKEGLLQIEKERINITINILVSHCSDVIKSIFQISDRHQIMAILSV